MLLGAVTENGFRARLLALDALVPIVAADNQLPSISTPQLAKVLMGETKNWSEIGGPDMPIVVHGMSQGSDLQTTLSARLGTDFTASVVHPNLAELAAAVAKDPWAIAMIGSTVVGNARKLPLTDSCGFTLSPSSFSVKAEDYPLTFPVFLVTPPRRLGLIAREFLEFVETPQAQKEIETTGYITGAAKEQPLVGDAVRLMNALRFADQNTALGDLKRLAESMNRSTRLSFTFRFQDGSDQLNAQAKTSLADLARLIDLGVYRHQHLVLAGFSGGFEDKAENLATSRADAMIVLNALNSLLSQSDKTQIPQIDAFGDVLPVACDKTTAGKSLNRRVEVWLQPSLAKAP
jgi:phosphate transport system substrate-binding protein